MAGAVLPYPTRGEAARRAAIGYFADYASNPLVRRVIGLVKTCETMTGGNDTARRAKARASSGGFPARCWS